jgi:hypothetical protein
MPIPQVRAERSCTVVVHTIAARACRRQSRRRTPGARRAILRHDRPSPLRLRQVADASGIGTDRNATCSIPLACALSATRATGVNMKSILDPTFRYTNSANTDVRKTFARIRREQKKRERIDATAAAQANVLVMQSRRYGAAS